MRRYGIIFLLLATAILESCGSGGRKSSLIGNSDTIYRPSYARGFAILGCGHSTILSIVNPWQGAQGIDNRTFIARDGENPPEGFEGTVIHTPIKRVVCMSSSHVAMIDMIGRIESVKAISGLRYIYNDTIRARAQAGLVKEIGYEGNIDCEQLAMLKPDVVFIYSVSGEKLPVTEKMKELDIPVVTIGDYLEPTPLGKAEWLVVFGELFDCRAKADSIFRVISSSYEQSKRLTDGIESRPQVMLNSPWRDTWFVPGDRSYMVRLIRDAGAEYVCRGVDSEQSRAINGEQAYLYASKADYWLNPNDARTMTELLSQNPRMAGTPAVVNQRVYNNTRRYTSASGSDFWESGAVRADIVLRDLIKIFHPELEPDHTLYYYKHLE